MRLALEELKDFDVWDATVVRCKMHCKKLFLDYALKICMPVCNAYSKKCEMDTLDSIFNSCIK